MHTKIMWFAFLMSHLVFLGISYVITPSTSELEPNITYILCGIGISQFALTIWLPSILKQIPKPTLRIIQYALLDTCSIFGFIAFFLAEDRMVQGLLATLGIIGMLWLYPKEEVKGRIPPTE